MAVNDTTNVVELDDLTESDFIVMFDPAEEDTDFRLSIVVPSNEWLTATRRRCARGEELDADAFYAELAKKMVKGWAGASAESLQAAGVLIWKDIDEAKKRLEGSGGVVPFTLKQALKWVVGSRKFRQRLDKLSMDIIEVKRAAEVARQRGLAHMRDGRSTAAS